MIISVRQSATYFTSSAQCYFDGKLYTTVCSMRRIRLNVDVGHSLKLGLDSLALLGLKWSSKLTLLLTFNFVLLLTWNLT